MPAYIPVPEGLNVPQEPTFELPVTFELRDGMLYALAVDGMPVPEEGEEAEGEMPEEEMSGEDMDFMAAVEQGMAR
jgi:hypothetical protein